MNKEYLGDSVYVALDEDGWVVLTTENGYGASNTIVMEPEVLKKFNKWLSGSVALLGNYKAVCDSIHTVLDRNEWNSDSTERIADLLRGAGYVLRDVQEEESPCDTTPTA